MITNTSITKSGDVYKERSKRGITYFAFNHEQGRVPKRGIGTLTAGGVYEKKAAIYRNKNGLSLSQSEYGAILADGARVIRWDVPGVGKFAIDVDRFERFKEPLYDPRYGPQWLINLSYCSKGKNGTRNPIIDNPPLMPAGTEFERPQPQQLPMFDVGIRRDTNGNTWGG